MIRKQYLKSKSVCKVTFVLPDAIQADTVNLVGDFNDWNELATPMQRRNGEFRVSLDLDPGCEYQFRYLVNGAEWHNDWHADGYVPNPYCGENSVVQT